MPKSLTKVALLATAASLSVAPATARERSPELAEKLSDPALQQSLAVALAAMSEAMLDIKVAPFAKAMAAMGDHEAERIAPDATLGDLAGPDAQRVPREMASRLPPMMGAMAGMTDAMEKMLPELENMARKVGDAALDAGGRRRP